MKSRKLTSAIVAGALLGTVGASAFAGDKLTAERDINWQSQLTSAATRAQVAGELKQSGAQNGLVQDGSFEYAYPRQADTKSNRSIEQSRTQAATSASAAADFNPEIYFGS